MAPRKTEIYENVAHDIYWMSNFLSKCYDTTNNNEKKSITSVRGEILKTLIKYDEKQMDAFRKLMFGFDLDKKNKTANRLKRIYIKVKAEKLLDRLSKFGKGAISTDNRISNSVKSSLVGGTEDEYEMLYKYVARAYSKVASYNTADTCATIHKVDENEYRKKCCEILKGLIGEVREEEKYKAITTESVQAITNPKDLFKDTYQADVMSHRKAADCIISMEEKITNKKKYGDEINVINLIHEELYPLDDRTMRALSNILFADDENEGKKKSKSKDKVLEEMKEHYARARVYQLLSKLNGFGKTTEAEDNRMKDSVKKTIAYAGENEFDCLSKAISEVYRRYEIYLSGDIYSNAKARRTDEDEKHKCELLKGIVGEVLLSKKEATMDANLKIMK